MPRYKLRCYKKNGDLDHEETAQTLEDAKEKRTAWGLKIGLKPEPSSDFALYPTIWERKGKEYVRIPGY